MEGRAGRVASGVLIPRDVAGLGPAAQSAGAPAFQTAVETLGLVTCRALGVKLPAWTVATAVASCVAGGSPSCRPATGPPSIPFTRWAASCPLTNLHEGSIISLVCRCGDQGTEG